MTDRSGMRPEDDPAWLLARAVYLFPDADTPDERLFIRFDAAREIRDIERRYERSGVPGELDVP